MYGFASGAGMMVEAGSDCVLKSLTVQENDIDSASREELAPAVTARSDGELLQEYGSTRCDDVFAQIVNRHAPWVYSSALRQVGSPTAAQDITQAVFIILARKAATLRRETVLSGWLFRAARYAAVDVLRSESRRLKREQEAVAMQLDNRCETPEAGWEQVAPLLDEALAGLGAKDRHAVLLRFFEKKSFGEIGETLGGNENSARVRVVRAVEKLRVFFRKRGVVVSAVALSGALLTNVVQAMPSSLVLSWTGSATATGPVVALMESTIQRLLWRRVVRIGAAIVMLLLLIGAATLVVRQRQAARAAELAEAGRSVRNLMIAIDRTYTLNDPNGFVALIHFRDRQETEFGPVLADYVRAQLLFRREMQRAFNVRQRTFNVTFRELCFLQPPEPPTYIRSDSAATNIMMAKYPVRFVKAAGAWKWDLFDGLSREECEQRIAFLRHKTVVLDKLAGQVREGTATNVVEILETVRSAMP